LHVSQVDPDQYPAQVHFALLPTHVDAWITPSFAQVAVHPTGVEQVVPVKSSVHEQVPVEELHVPPLLHCTLAHLLFTLHVAPENVPTHLQVPSLVLQLPPLRQLTLLAKHKLVMEKLSETTHKSLEYLINA
jgi:hypothetical protein